MEENRQLTELLEQMKKNEERRNRYAKWQFLASLVTAVCCVLILGIGIGAYVTVVPGLKDALGEIQTVTADLNRIAEQLTEADLAGLVEHVDRLAVTSEEGMTDALEKIESIDIDELNRAIKALSDVVTPLARLMGKFS